MKKTSLYLVRFFTATTFAVGISAIAHAQDKATQLHDRATAAMCSNCHGTEGRTVEGSAIPSLVGMPKDYHVLQMQVMHQITKGLTDAQINTIATYYAAIKR